MKARSLFFISALPLLIFSAGADANVSIFDANGWKVDLGGFIEMDSISDSTRSFNELIANKPVSRPDSQAGESGRYQMSVRNSRLSFGIRAPEQDGWKTRSYFEFDLLGYDPAPNSGSGNTESSFFQNPTLRLRHGFLEADKNEWRLLAGQYWDLLGWQPYFFIPTVQVSPIPAMLYNRAPQLRALGSFDVATETHAQVAAAIMRPPQEDSGLPGLETGLRLSFDGRKGGFVGGATPPEQAQPLSIAVSGALREFSVSQNVSSTPSSGQMNHFTGHALAVDALVPILASSDGKDVSNTLTVGGEYTSGTGDGDQFSGWTGGLGNPLGVSTLAAPQNNVNLDGGIGGFESTGAFTLIDLKTFNLYAQYHLPQDWKTWVSGGYGRLYSDNLISVAASSGGGLGSYNKEEVAFANIMKDLTAQVRIGFEYAHIRTTYDDGTIANDNRYQLSAFFIF